MFAQSLRYILWAGSQSPILESEDIRSIAPKGARRQRASNGHFVYNGASPHVDYELSGLCLRKIMVAYHFACAGVQWRGKENIISIKSG